MGSGKRVRRVACGATWKGSGRLPFACMAVALSLLVGCGDVKLNDPVLEIQLSESFVDYGAVALGSASKREVRIRNRGRAQIFVSAVSVPAPFAIEGLPAEGLRLGSTEERRFKLVFAPEVEGKYTAGLDVYADDQEEPRSIALTGRGVKAFVSCKADTLDYGRVTMGTSKVLGIECTNTGELATRIGLRIDGMDADQFTSSLIQQGRGAMEFAPGESRQLPIAFAPNHLGSSEAWAHVTPCEDCQEMNVALSGHAVASCIAVNPVKVEFGTIDLGKETEQTITIENIGNEQVELTDAYLTASSSSSYQVRGFKPGQSFPIPAGGTQELTVVFKPSGKDLRTGTLKLRASSASETCYAEVNLEGAGGTGCLDVSPRSIDFGSVATSMSSTKKLFVANTSCGSDVWLNKVELTGAEEFSAGTQRPVPYLLRQGDVTEISVSFSPATSGDYEASLKIEATDDQRQPLTRPPPDIPIKGNARNLPPCEFVVLPPRLDFGAVTANTTSSLAMTIKNTGSDACFFTNVALTPNSAKEFRLSSSVRSSFILDPGEISDVIVRFTPTAVGSFMANLEFYVSDPKNPYQSYPIFGRAVTGCLSIQPNDLDFGTVFVGCASPKRQAVVTNGCTGPVTIQSLVKGAGNSTEFSISQQPTFPRTLNPGESFLVEVSYAPVDDGNDFLPLFFDDGTDKRLLSVGGRGELNPSQTDRFEQADRAKVDVLFVIDNSGSMMEEQEAVGRNFSSFLKFAVAQGIDYNIGVTSTGIDPSPGGWSSCPGGVEGGEAGRLFPVDNTSPRIITSSTPNAQAVFANNVKVGVCHWLEQGLEAAYRALSAPLVNNADDPRTPISLDGNGGLLRPDAKLAVVFVSDEEDQSAQTVEFYATHLRSLKPNPSQITVSAIVGPHDLATCPTASSSGSRYMDLARRTGGVVDSICTADWATSLEKLSQNAFGPSTVFQLSQRPGDPSKLRVRVNGLDVGGWRYDPAANTVVFEQSTAPAAGSSIEIKYPLGCP